MAIEFSENFEIGPGGATITDLNTAFDSVTGTMTATFDGSSVIDGALAARCAIATSGDITMRRDFADRSVSHKRFYVRLNAAHTGSPWVAEYRGGATRRAVISIDPSGFVRIHNVTTVVATSTTAVPVGAWARIEHKLDTTAGTQTARIFTGANLHGKTPTNEITGAAPAAVSFDNSRIGVLNTAGVVDYSIDALADDTADWTGPIATAARTHYRLTSGGTWQPCEVVLL